MEPALAGLAADARSALGTIVAPGADVGLAWLILGLGLHLANQIARGRGWWAVVDAAARPERVPRRHAVAAWIAGAGVAGIVTARLGDALRVVLLARAAPVVGRARLAGTLVAEAVGDVAVGSLLTAVALLLGVGGGFGRGGIVVAAGAAVAGVAVLARRWGVRRARTSRTRRARGRRATRVLAELRGGCAALGSPGAYARRVLPWQVASRGLRLASLACFLAAFGLPVSPQSVLLVVLAQTAGNVIPFSPAAVTAGAATLAATFGPLTGSAATSGRLVAFYVCTIGLLSVTGVVCAAAITAAITARRRRARPHPGEALPEAATARSSA